MMPTTAVSREPPGFKPSAACEPGEMLSQLKRHEVQVLLRAGFSAPEIALRSAVSLDSVRRIAREDEVTHTDDAAARKARQLGRPSKASPFAEVLTRWLSEEPELPTQELFRRAKEQGYDGAKSALYSLVAALRPPRKTPVVRFEGLPGEFSQHDFGHVDVTFVDGRRKRVHFFASRLKFSRFVAVTLVENERVETVVRCLVRDFRSFGGLPLLAVFDRPRTIVSKSGKGRAVEQFNSTFAQAIVEIGVGVEMCAPRSGNQKGAVERLVGWVKSSFFKPRKFVDEADLVAQLAAWVTTVNTQTPSRATGELPETRRQQELPRLRPLKVFPETLALRIPVFVGPTAEVHFEGVAYSMPPEAVHVAGTLFLYEDRVRIEAGRFRAEHRRRRKTEPPAPLPSHRAAKLEAVHGPRAKLYEKREQVLRLGGGALTLLTELTHRERAHAHTSVEALYELLVTHGDDALRTAIARAVAANTLSVDGVRSHLGKGDGGRGASAPRALAEPPRGTATTRAKSPANRAARGKGAR